MRHIEVWCALQDAPAAGFYHSLRLLPVIFKKKNPAAAYFPACEGSIIGAGGLDFRVRDGNGYNPSAVAAGQKSKISGLPERGRGRNEGRGKQCTA